MKKFAAIILVLALSIMFTSAFATEKTFDMACITDLEGNVMYAVLEDNTVVDPEGNPVDGIPYITLTIDDEALTFVVSTADNAIQGTIEVLESTEEQITLQLIPEAGEVVTAVCTTEDGFAITLISETSNMMIIMTETEAA